MSKVLIMILGAGATGKTTLSRALAGKDPTEHKVDLTVTEKRVRKRVKAPYVLGSHIAIAGNLKSTSDAIGAMDALHQTIDHCWKQRDVVIMDGFRCTNKLVRWVEEHPLKPAALFVYIELSLNSNLARLRGRRERNGKIEAKLPPKTFLNVLSFRDRALGVWNYAQDHYKHQPVRYLEIPEGLGPEEAARLVESELSKLQEPGTQFENAPEPPVLNVEDISVESILNGQSFDQSLAHWEEQLQDRTPVENSGGTNLELQSGMDFREPEYRREVFLRFYQFHTQFKLHPGLVYLLIPYLRKRLGWDLEQMLWFCFINGNTQHPPTSWLIFKRFPDFATLDTAALIEFFNCEWERLEFDTDRRHQKRDFPRAIECYKDLCGDSQEEYFAGFINGSDQEQNFRSAWATVRRDFYGFGRLSAFSYLEYLRIARLPLVCDQLFLSDINGSKSHRNGLCKVLGRDDWDWHKENPVKYTPKMIAYLEGEGAKLLADARDRYPSFDTNYFTLESALCAYKNWFRGRRYPGIYADMFYERVTKAERRWPEEDFGMFWDAYRTLPDYVQSETGVSGEKKTRFRDTGQVIAMGNVWDCFMEQPMWHDAIYDLTPVEKIGDIWFKREDKFSPDGMHNGSKFRQLIWLFSRRQHPGVASGAVTGSPQLPMVAACAKHYGMKCVQFTGAMKGMALAGKKLGAKTKLVNPGYAGVLNKRAKDYAARRSWLRIETNITVTTSDADVEAFHRVGSEQVRNLPDHMETLIIPAGSRNSAVSILYGLHRYPPKSLKKVIFMHINKNRKKHEKEMWARLRTCGVTALPYRFETHDVFAKGYTTYEKLMPFAYNGLNFHGRYEGKCWNYIKDHPKAFRPYMNDKTLFWIVGSEPKSCVKQDASPKAEMTPDLEAMLTASDQ